VSLVPHNLHSLYQPMLCHLYRTTCTHCINQCCVTCTAQLALTVSTNVVLLVPHNLHSLYQPTKSTNNTIQFVASIKLLHVSAPECHLQEVCCYKNIHFQQSNPCIKANGTCIPLFWCLSEDGNPVPKHVAVWCLPWIVLYGLYFIAYVGWCVELSTDVIARWMQ